MYSLGQEEEIRYECDKMRQIEDHSEINYLMNALSPEQREAVILRFGEQLAFKEIAKIVGCNVRTAQSRVGIAQALLNNPNILILDEPTAGLDPKERVRFRNLLSDYLLMKDGKFVLQGTVPELTRKVEGKVWELTVSPAEAKNGRKNRPLRIYGMKAAG